MSTTAEDLRGTAGRLSDLLDIYDRFIHGWPYQNRPVSTEIGTELLKQDTEASESVTRTGMELVNEVTALYHRARDAQAAYIQQTRARGQDDWSQIVSDTKPIRQTILRVHAAGFGIDPDTGAPGYTVPKALSSAHHVSMNRGTSPVTYEERVTQYRAIADRFDIDPDVVYHPGSGHDVSLSKAFPDSQVEYADIDTPTMADLSRAGYTAHGTDGAGYVIAGGADMIVFRNAGLLEEAVVETNLRSGGWVVANDHLESARHLTQLDSLRLVGVVPDEWPGDSPPVEILRTERRDSVPIRGDSTCAKHSPRQIERGSPLSMYVFRCDS